MEKCLIEVAAILKSLETEIDSAVWRKTRQATPLLHGGDRLDAVAGCPGCESATPGSCWSSTVTSRS